MPEPVRSSQRYMPGLDGLRAVAVLAVIAYHLELGWAPGGLLGVGVFFTLSGYLITDLLLAQWARGRLALGDFWLRRARRLLPALFVMLVVVTVWVSIADQSQMPTVRGQVGAATVYVSNWWQIFQHVSYFARFGPPSPLNHLWSLAVEEQFYLFWPWILLLGVTCVRERKRPIHIRPRLAGVTLALALASAIEMAALYHPSFDPSRVYDGTDTRAFALLIGAALAMVWPSRLLTDQVNARARGILDGAGTVGLVVIALLIWRTNQYSSFLYHGGIVLLSIASVVVVAALAHPATRLGHGLGWAPLRWIGVRSYGIYLWAVPIIVLSRPAPDRGVDALRAVLQVTAIIVVSALSWRYVEEPIRHGALGRLWAHARSAGWQPRSMPRGVRVALTAAAAALVLATAALAGIDPPAPVTSALAGISVEPSHAGPSVSGTSRAAAAGGHTAARGRAPAASRGVPYPARPRIVSTRSSCRGVAHIGDSTSEGLISSDYLPDPGQRIGAQYARVGATDQRLEISGATSIVETLPGGTNAQAVARGLRSGGYRGCWVIALGTNDTADIYVGSSVNLSTRIARMMAVIGNAPVMWVNAKSLVASGPYAESNMQLWNAALTRACAKYSNMRAFDWASVAQDNWFIADGIHYTSAGYAGRAQLIATALAQAFPASGHSTGTSCVVHVPPAFPRVLGVPGQTGQPG